MQDGHWKVPMRERQLPRDNRRSTRLRGCSRQADQDAAIEIAGHAAGLSMCLSAPFDKAVRTNAAMFLWGMKDYPKPHPRAETTSLFK